MANPNMKTYAIIRDPLMQQLIPQGQLRPFNEGLSRQLRAQQDAIEPVGYMDAAFDAVKEATGSTAAALAATSFSPSTIVKGLSKAPYALGVVKNPGGNWPDGSVERHVYSLRNHVGGVMNDWLDANLPKYIKNYMGTERDPLLALAEAYPAKQAAALAAKDQQIIKATAARDAYMQREGITDPAMATQSNAVIRKLQDERQLIASRQPLHTTFDGASEWVNIDTEGLRAAFSDRLEGIAKTEQGRRFENAADSSFSPKRLASDYVNRKGIFPEHLLRENPWLATVPPNTVVHSLSSVDELGFDHLVDELTNALNPASGLPKHLLLTPEQLKKTTLVDAVNRVADINAWRLAQKTAADAAIAGNIATRPVKEFAENNPAGVRISRIMLPEGADPTDIESEGAQALNKAIKYEADLMGHSVEGYRPEKYGGSRYYGHGGWEGLTSGRAQLYSVRDATGRPHATLEVDTSTGGLPSITQIKGLGNKDVSPEYTRFIKDFLNNPPEGVSQWGLVKDLSKAGLRSSDQLWNKRELDAIRKAGVKVDKYLDKDEFMRIKREVWPNDLTGDYPWNSWK